MHPGVILLPQVGGKHVRHRWDKICHHSEEGQKYDSSLDLETLLPCVAWRYFIKLAAGGILLTWRSQFKAGGRAGGILLPGGGGWRWRYFINLYGVQIKRVVSWVL